MWKKYFYRRKIYGIDIYDKSNFDENRIKRFQGYQNNTDFLDQVLTRIGKIDVIIDDGSHINQPRPFVSGSPAVATNVGGIPEVIALATEKLSLNEKEIFDRCVKLVEPNSESIRNGIDTLLNNNSSIEYYINLVPKFRHNFLWSTRLYKFHTILAEL